ncbi:MAG: hypothetical protein CMG46_02595 [Candidatus Marinimicrobia bacterium]|nr:hypothetical protein [Candidatus Neomarinimicrobiota bacterium]
MWFSKKDINISTIIPLNDIKGYVLPHASTKYTGDIISHTLRFKPKFRFNKVKIIYYPSSIKPNVRNTYHEYYVPYNCIRYVIETYWKIKRGIDYSGYNVLNGIDSIQYEPNCLYIVSADFSHYLPLQKAISLENRAAHALLHQYINNASYLDTVDHIDSFRTLYNIINNQNIYLQWIGRTRSPGIEAVGYLSFILRQSEHYEPDGLFVTAYDRNMNQRECLGIWFDKNQWNQRLEDNKVKEVIKKAKTTSRLTNGKFINIPITHYTVTYLYEDLDNSFIRGWHGIRYNAFYLPNVILENTYNNGKWIDFNDIEWSIGSNFNMNETLTQLTIKGGNNHSSDIQLYSSTEKHITI